MPKYGLHKYGRFKYGKYQLSASGSGGAAIGPHVRYRIRAISESGRRSRMLEMCEDRVAIPSQETVMTRMRADDGDWVRTMNASIAKEASKTRIRSVDASGRPSKWVVSDRGTMR